MAQREGFELEPLCWRQGPQAKSRAQRGTSFSLEMLWEIMAEREGFKTHGNCQVGLHQLVG